MYQKILVPLDGSELAEQALPHVQGLAKCLGSEIVLLQVLTHKTYDYLLDDAAMSESLRTSERTLASDYITPLLEQLKENGFTVSAHVATASGAIADAIVEFGRRHHADLIAMSTHGRTGPARWVLGSVADRVVRGAGIPVLLIHPH